MKLDAARVQGPHDPFFPLVLPAQATTRLELGIAWDLQALSRGRFLLATFDSTSGCQ